MSHDVARHRAFEEDGEWESTVNPVLREIIDTGLVRMADGSGTLPLHSSVSESEGEALRDLVSSLSPSTSVEVGLAYGVSALWICEALKTNARHAVIDPKQREGPWGNAWKGIGLANLERAGFGSLIDFRGEPSFRALASLEREGTRLDFAFIDGIHYFDYALVDFFFVDRMLRAGGIVAFDDADWPAIRKVCRFVVENLHYSVVVCCDGEPGRPSILRRSLGALGRTSGKVGRVVRPEVLRPDDALGLSGTMVALRKERDDDRFEKRLWDYWIDF
jgi:predicted O-methyltransferase YrrM